MTGLEFLGLPPEASIGTILSKLYIFGVGLVALSALVMFTLGGVRYMLSGDRDPTEAKNWMKNAFWGLVLALTSWLILYTINPDLVKTLTLRPLGIQQLTTPQAPARQEFHSACVNNVCTQVDGPGVSDCSACPSQEGVWHCEQTGDTDTNRQRCEDRCIFVEGGRQVRKECVLVPN